MAAIILDRQPISPQRPPLRAVTAPPSRRRPTSATYRRRRFVVVLVALLVVLAAAGSSARILGPSAAAAGAAPVAPVAPLAPIVAQPGDSYWTLAEAVSPGGDLRATVDALVDANGGRELHVGDRIILTP